jgi:predicted esterase
MEVFVGSKLKLSLALALLHATLAFAAPSEPAPRMIPGTQLEQREVVDTLGRSVTYYISRPKAAKAPILLMLQGSGCARLINLQPGNFYSTLFNLVPFAEEGRFTVVAVEKPFADGKGGGTAQSCNTEFNRDFTAERWLVAIRAALDDARKSPWVDPARTLAFGFSEGAVMADMLAGRDTTITDVVAMGGSGTTQLFDFVALAYQRCFDTSTCLADIDRDVDAINANTDSSTDFAWGHPYKRWSSFFRLDPGEELLRSKARVYIAFGTADDSVPPLSEELAIAKLRLARRDVTVRRVPNAGHTMSEGSRANYDDLAREYRAALDWFWKGGR